MLWGCSQSAGYAFSPGLHVTQAFVTGPDVYGPRLLLLWSAHGSTLLFLGLQGWPTPANTFSQLPPRAAGWELFHSLSATGDFAYLCSSPR